MIVEELKELALDILETCCRAYAEGSTDQDFFRLGSEAFAACPSNSIDYAVEDIYCRLATEAP